MTQAITTIDFHGDALVAVQHRGEPHVAMKPVSEALGLDWSAQWRRIQRDEVLSEGVAIMAIPSAGGPQEATFLPARYLNGWLFGVDVTRVRPDLRERLLTYKRECYAVLDQHFRGGGRPSGVDAAAIQAAVRDGVAQALRGHGVEGWPPPPVPGLSGGRIGERERAALRCVAAAIARYGQRRRPTRLHPVVTAVRLNEAKELAPAFFARLVEHRAATSDRQRIESMHATFRRYVERLAAAGVVRLAPPWLWLEG